MFADCSDMSYIKNNCKFNINGICSNSNKLGNFCPDRIQVTEHGANTPCNMNYYKCKSFGVSMRNCGKSKACYDLF